MDQQTFILAMSDIANRLYSSYYNESSQVQAARGDSQALAALIRNNLAQLDTSIERTEKGNNSQNQILQLMEILKDDNIVEILGCVHKSMMPYYSYYADQKTGYMNFHGFSRFCADFEIFPDILSKPKILRFFKTLSSFFESTNKQNQQLNGPNETKDAGDVREMVDEHLFVEALALTAFEIVY